MDWKIGLAPKPTSTTSSVFFFFVWGGDSATTSLSDLESAALETGDFLVQFALRLHSVIAYLNITVHLRFLFFSLAKINKFHLTVNLCIKPTRTIASVNRIGVQLFAKCFNTNLSMQHVPKNTQRFWEHADQ